MKMQQETNLRKQPIKFTSEHLIVPCHFFQSIFLGGIRLGLLYSMSVNACKAAASGTKNKLKDSDRTIWYAYLHVAQL